jgi:hypothetical protein
VAFDHPLTQRFCALRFFGDLAQGTTGFLSLSRSIVRATLPEFPARGVRQQNQLEPVRNLVNAIFDRNAGHGKLLSRIGGMRGLM